MENPAIHRSFPPLCGDAAHILILGTFPSPISREKGEYYGNPRNLFWRILFDVFGAPFDAPDYTRKKALLSSGGIALWDVIAACEAGSALDSSIRHPVYNTELPEWIKRNGIRKVFFNGGNAYTFYKRGIGAIPKNVLPSTSPAHARMCYNEKLRLWQHGLCAGSQDKHF